MFLIGILKHVYRLFSTLAVGKKLTFDREYTLNQKDTMFSTKVKFFLINLT